MEKSKAIQKHLEWKGKIEVIARAEIENKEDLAIAYTPGVAEPCLEIAKDESLAYEYTRKGNPRSGSNRRNSSARAGDIGLPQECR